MDVCGRQFVKSILFTKEKSSINIVSKGNNQTPIVNFSGQLGKLLVIVTQLERLAENCFPLSIKIHCMHADVVCVISSSGHTGARFPCSQPFTRTQTSAR